MPAEIAPEVRAKQITAEYVNWYVANELPKAPNKLRGVNLCILGLNAKLKSEGLPRELYPLQATIGDIDPWELGLNFNGEMDPFEQGQFANLAERLGFDPEPIDGVYDKVRQRQKEIEIKYKYDRLSSHQSLHVPTRYYPEGGRGTVEAREIMSNEMRQLGIEAEPGDVWMGYGGMDIIQRTVRAVNTYFETKLDPMDRRKPLLLSPTVGFTMATNSAKLNGPEVDYVPTSDLPNNELTGDRLEQYFEQGGTIPDMMLLTPANNPTAQSSNPETLRGVIETMMKKNKSTVFIFDMAYMWTIPPEKAKKIIEVLKDTGADKNAVYIVSESKRMGRPGTRIAGAVVRDEQLRKHIDMHMLMNADTMSNEPSWSGELDTYYQALADKDIIPEQTYEDLSALLHQRQMAFLDVLKALDPEHRFFDEEIDRVVVPGDGKVRKPDSIEQDIPLYLWLKLKQGVTAFDVLKELGIGGSPSEVFGPEHGDADHSHLRLSMGFASTSDILSKSKPVFEKWSSQMK